MIHLEGEAAVRFQEAYEERGLAVCRLHILQEKISDVRSEIHQLDEEMRKIAEEGNELT